MVAIEILITCWKYETVKKSLPLMILISNLGSTIIFIIIIILFLFLISSLFQLIELGA